MVLRRTKTPRSAASSPHDVYSVTCSCGETLTGERDTHPLVIECPGCSEPLYVLPRDVYPRPKVLVPQVEPEPELEEDSDVPELSIEEIEDDDRRLAEPRDDTPPRIWIDRPRGALVRKRILQVSMLILLLLAATLWGVSRRARRTAAESTLFEQSEAAWDFVSHEEWDEARQAAEKAVAAADYLGRDDPASEKIRGLRDELVVLSELSTKSLIGIVLEKQEEDPDPAMWKSVFSARHGGNWLLLEGVIVRRLVDDVPVYTLEYPISVQDQNVDLVWDEPVEAFEDFEWNDDRHRVFIAVRMLGVRFLGDDSNSWSIILSPDDVRLWTNAALLTEAFGVDLNSEEARPLLELLESQSPADRVERGDGNPAGKNTAKQDGGRQPDSTTDRSTTGEQQ